MIPSEILKFIPKEVLSQSSNINYLTKVLNVLTEYNLNKIQKSYENAKKYGKLGEQGLESLQMFLNESGLFNFETPKLINTPQKVYESIKKTRESFERNAEKGATLQDELLYGIGSMAKFAKENPLKELNNLIEIGVSDEGFEKFDVNIVDEDDVDEDENDLNSPYKEKLNALIFAYLTAGESEVREILKNRGYNFSTTNLILKKVRMEAKKNEDKYAHFVDQIKKTRKAKKEYEQLAKESQNIFGKFGLEKDWRSI